MQTRYFPTGLRSIDEKARTAEFVISDASVDRHGTVLDEKWDLKNYNANGIVGYQHDVYGTGFLTGANPDNVIGKSQARWEDGKLIAGVEFEPKEMNELAEKIFQKVIFGTLKASSVGFLPLEEGEMRKVKEGEKERKIFYFGKRELLEWSIVNIPSNPNALARNFGDDIFGQYDFAEKDQRPFENEHAARLRDPDLFNPDTFRRTKDGKAALPGAGVIEVPDTIGLIWGKLKTADKPEDSPLVQAMRFPIADWTEAEAKKYLEDNKIDFLTFEPAEKKVTNLFAFQKSLYLCRKIKLIEAENMTY